VPKYAVKRSSHPEPMSMRHMISDIRQQHLEPFREVGIPSTTDSLAISDVLPSASQSDVTDSSHSQTWSAVDTPMHSTATWSTGNTAASPASSSHEFFFRFSFHAARPWPQRYDHGGQIRMGSHRLALGKSPT
jgi:hypothetical protein